MKPFIYFAGKVNDQGYRLKLANRIMSEGHIEYTYQGRSFVYGGPFAASCDHRCFHSPAGYHGLEANDNGMFIDSDGSDQWVTKVPHEKIIERCYNQIRRCDIFYCFINSLDCWGTLLELGYARALGKPIYIVMDKKTDSLCSVIPENGVEPKDELWFMKEDSETTFTVSDDEFALLSLALQYGAL